MRRVSFTLSDEDYELLRRVADRHDLKPGKFCAIAVMREAVISAGLEDEDTETRRALPTLPPPRSK